MESNSRGYRRICIALEEDKLHQRLTSTKQLLDLTEQEWKLFNLNHASVKQIAP